MLICRTRDISKGGCLLDTVQVLAPGTLLHITVMDDRTGDAISMDAVVARSVPPGPEGVGRGLGVRLTSAPDAWDALVDRQQSRRHSTATDVAAMRLSILVVGAEERRRGALALYVTSGWDVRFATGVDSAREAISGVALDAVVVEGEVADDHWAPVMELARDLQPQARRLVRARLQGRRAPVAASPTDLVHRFVDGDAGLDALLDALTADFGFDSFDTSLRSRQVDLMIVDDPPETSRPPAIHAPPLEGDEAAGLLRRVLAAARDAGSRGIVVFDLDSTLLDNSPRQARIMREYGLLHNVPTLARTEPDHWDGWDPRAAMANVGLSEDEIERHAEPFKAFWRERFFTSRYCVMDRPIPGAAAFAAAAARTGARVLYVTGRHEPMREGTVRSFRPAGIPEPDGDRIQLIMKPSLDESDDDYKRRTYAWLHELGVVVAAFDNEPTHINGYREVFQDAICIHLATDCSPRAIPVARDIPSIRNFSRT